MPTASQQDIPIQPVNKLILCSPYDEPTEHWVYETRFEIVRQVVWQLTESSGKSARLRLAARRWVAAVNHWGKLGRWAFQVCRDPQMLGRILGALQTQPAPIAD